MHLISEEPHMADEETVESAGSTETPDNPYITALMTAWQELQVLQEQERELTVKKAQLKKTTEALWPLAFPESGPDVNAMTLADTIRLVVKSCNERAVSVKEIRGKLQDIGVDLSKYSNALASIHTAVARMVETEELCWLDDDGKKLTAGPELKPIPAAEVDHAVMIGMLGQNTAGEE